MDPATGSENTPVQALDAYVERTSIVQVRQALLNTSAARNPGTEICLDIRSTYQAYSMDASHPTVAMVGRTLADMGLEPRLEPSGGGSDAIPGGEWEWAEGFERPASSPNAQPPAVDGAIKGRG